MEQGENVIDNLLVKNYIDNDVVIYGPVNMHAKANNLNAVILDVRLCFNLLRSMADELHKDLGVNASMRAVMESLADGNEKTVPEIARSRGVSRQHIQVIANRLIKANLVKACNNPDDRRTFLISLTSRGRAFFDEIREREEVELRRLSGAFSSGELEAARTTLRKLSDILKGGQNE